jgi:hypothetical protein
MRMARFIAVMKKVSALVGRGQPEGVNQAR